MSLKNRKLRTDKFRFEPCCDFMKEKINEKEIGFDCYTDSYTMYEIDDGYYSTPIEMVWFCPRCGAKLEIVEKLEDECI